MSYIENENIPKTNNWLELYFNIVYPKKNIEEDLEHFGGAKTFLRHGKIRWYERVVLKEEIKIEKKDNWTKLIKKYAIP